MKLQKSSLFIAVMIGLMGCQSTSESSAVEETVTNLSPQETIDFMSRCDNPDSLASGPIKQPLYVVGSFPDADWKHVPARQYQYKGNNFYQAVTVEKEGSYKMQYATELWSPQFTAKGRRLNVGELMELTFGGYGTDTTVDIQQSGKYVWSLQFDEKGKPLNIMVNPCK
ncbi:glycosidase [Vibrio cincinnatiensis]